MRAKIWFLVKYYLFWIVLSILAKVIFLLYEKEMLYRLRIIFKSFTGDYSWIFHWEDTL